MKLGLIHIEEDSWAFGIRSVSSMLKKHGHQTRMLIMPPKPGGYDTATLAGAGELLQGVDLVGVSCFSKGSMAAHQLIKSLKGLKKPVVWGGLHATLNPRECVESADIVCVGEGEGMIIDLVRRLEEGKDWTDIPNLAYTRKGTTTVNPLRQLETNLDALPEPDFSFADEYRLRDGGFVKMPHLDASSDRILFNGSRGCAYHCTYCSNAKLKEMVAGKGRYVRRLSVSAYIEQVKSLRKQFPKATYFYLLDEDFFAWRPEDLMEFSREFPRQVGMPFECLASPMQINERKLEMLVGAGLFRVRMGVESGSDRLKKEVYLRNMPNSAVLGAATALSKYPQVVPYYFLIIANPYEEQADLLETIRFLLKLPVRFYLQCFNLVFFPGTQLFERAVRDNLIGGKEDSGFELNYRGGLHYEKHAWKRKNLYLNGLLFLMDGKSTSYRLGMIPRFVVPFLITRKAVQLGERYLVFVRLGIWIKKVILSLYDYAAKMLSRIISDPKAIYRFKYFLKTGLLNRKRQAARVGGAGDKGPDRR